MTAAPPPLPLACAFTYREPLLGLSKQFHQKRVLYCPLDGVFVWVLTTSPWAMQVWVNGRRVGGHKGGFAPWRVEITDAVNGDTTVATVEGTHELVVRVVDSTDGAQPRGKQSKQPKGIWYTSVSGIWQTVWVEAVPLQHISNIKLGSRQGIRRAKVLLVTPTLDLPKSMPSISPGALFRCGLRAMGGGAMVGTKPWHEVPVGGFFRGGAGGTPATLAISVSDPKLWTPTSPYLYDLECQLVDGRGVLVSVAQHSAELSCTAGPF